MKASTCQTCLVHPAKHQAYRVDKVADPWVVCDRCRDQGERLRTNTSYGPLPTKENPA